MRLGAIDVTAISDGFAKRPVSGLITNVSDADVVQALRDAGLPDDCITSAYTSLVVKTDQHVVLFDAGNGDLGPPTSGSWMRNFNAAGFNTDDVTHIIFTHLHGDHINGYRLRDGSTPFPKARLLAPAAEWAYWMDDREMEAAAEIRRPAFANVRRVFTPVSDMVETFPAGEVLPGIRAIDAHGHSPGHTIFEVASGAHKMMVLADTTNIPALFARHPDWHIGFDSDPIAASATRKRVLANALAGGHPVHLYHAPFPAIGTIASYGDGFDFKPLPIAS